MRVRAAFNIITPDEISSFDGLDGGEERDLPARVAADLYEEPDCIEIVEGMELVEKHRIAKRLKESAPFDSVGGELI